MVQYFPSVTGSLTVNGNLIISGSVLTSGSVVIPGTASYASEALSSSYAVSSSYALSTTTASNANTASYGNATATVPFNIGDASTYYGIINSSTVGSNNLFTLSTGSYTAATFQYTVYNGSNSRAGQVIATWNNGTAQFTDFAAPSNGSTTAVTTSVTIVSSQVQLNFQTNTADWTIKSQGTLL